MKQMLTKGCQRWTYGKDGALPKPLPLTDGQCRSHDKVHNGVWFNRDGEKLGCGDLDVLDMLVISRCLPMGEVFVVLGETVGGWDAIRLHKRPEMRAMYGWGEHLDQDDLGKRYVALHCRFIIAREFVIYCDEWTAGPPKEAYGTYLSMEESSGQYDLNLRATQRRRDWVWENIFKLPKDEYPHKEG